MSNIRLNIDFIIGLATDAGLKPAQAVKLRGMLAHENEKHVNPLFDHVAGKLAKMLGCLSGSVFGDVPIEAAGQALKAATELQNRIILGQWSYVANELERLKTIAPLEDSQFEKNEEIDEICTFLRTFGHDKGGTNPPHFKASYAAHRFACVLACQKGDACAFSDCWETRCSGRPDEA